MFAGYFLRMATAISVVVSWFSFAHSQFNDNGQFVSIAGALIGVAIACVANYSTPEIKWCRKCNHGSTIQSSSYLHALLRVEMIAASVYTLLKFGDAKALPSDNATAACVICFILVLALINAYTRTTYTCNACNTQHFGSLGNAIGGPIKPRD